MNFILDILLPHPFFYKTLQFHSFCLYSHKILPSKIILALLPLYSLFYCDFLITSRIHSHKTLSCNFIHHNFLRPVSIRWINLLSHLFRFIIRVSISIFSSLFIFSAQPILALFSIFLRMKFGSLLQTLFFLRTKKKRDNGELSLTFQ